MNSSAAFLDLVFSESPREHTIKGAYELFSLKPYQLFDLLLKEERFTNFFSRIELYGNNLANLLGQFPRFEEHDYGTLLLGEIIRSFTLSLLSERFNDMKSRTVVARIVLSVVKLSDPTTLAQFGVRLGALPGILRILFAEGHIKQLALTHKEHFEQLVSEPQAMEQWTEVVMNLCQECEVHRWWPRRNGRVELARFFRTVPCGYCPDLSLDGVPEKDTEGESTAVLDYAPRSDIEPNVFKNLLGEPLGPWKIILSQQAMEDLTELNDQGDFENVRRKFYELASGDWTGNGKILHRSKWNKGQGYRIPIFESFYATGHFIFWQIDISLDESFELDYQVIKVWAIGKRKNLDRIGLHIHRLQESYTGAQVEACGRDDLDSSRRTRYPARVYLDEKKSRGMEVDEIEDEDFDDLAQLAEFYCLTETVLDNVLSTNRKVAFPVDISREEVTVVNHFQTPAFILGRSGTGKTICLVYKLVGKYLSGKGNGEPLRQVLLTKSEVLAGKLRDNTDGLIETKMGKREMPYGRNVDCDENTRKQFLSLSDEDFPLVCTFDYLLILIENSIREQESRGNYIKIENSKSTRVIDFVKFNLEYWESMPPRLKRGIPADLVFLEIMGVIKGLIFAATGFEPLSREEYLGVRWRMAPYFATERERAAVYDIYEWYERAKKKRGDIDQADIIIKVMRALEAFKSSEILEDKRVERNIRRMLDEIYVDEVQDQRTSEIGMLLTLVEFPWGIHFAGDTAQCISKDALFRFANAKSLFYERFKDSTKSTGDLKPTLLPLSHNYRAHKRILRIASLVMDLLYGGFPDLVDELSPEIGHLPGPKPTLYIGKNIIDLLKLERERETPLIPEASNKFNEYGEVRVILVRDEETRDKLRSELGQSSLVLTILQSKGMEFEDVFLYDFFSTSPYNRKLNILEELLKRRHQPDLYAKDPESHADWAKRNIVLCSELKHLYVGVTRARNRLCLLESNTCILNPVQRLFNQIANQLLPCRYPPEMLEVLSNDIGVSALHDRLFRGRVLSAAQWRELGYQSVNNQNYDDALCWFEKAGDHQGIALATAYIIENDAVTNRARGSFNEANLHFIDASESFLKAGRIKKAVQCRKEGGDQKGAVKILANSGAYEDAAWLAAENGLFSETSEIYTKLNKHELALAAYALGKDFKRMFSYLKKFESTIEPCCWKQYVRFCYVERFSGSDGILGEFEKEVLSRIGSLKEQETVLLRYNLLNKLFDWRHANKRYMEAYEGGVSSGLLEKSIQLLSNQALLKNLSPEQRGQLYVACKFLQAEHVATNSWPKPGEDWQIHKVLQAAVGRGSAQIDSFVKTWEDINQALKSFVGSGTGVEIGKLEDVQIAGYVDILVTRSVHPYSKFKIPFEHIERVLKDLNAISSHRMIPSSARLYCGIYQPLGQPGNGKHIALCWSPFSVNPKQLYTLRPGDVGSLRHKILLHILGDIVPPLVLLDEGLREIWTRKTATREPHFKKVESLARLCWIFLETSALINRNRRPNDSLPLNWDWEFWSLALLDQMQFRSPYEHSVEELLNTKSELMMTEGKYRAVYLVLIKDDTTEHRMKSAAQLGVGACVSSLLAQYQTSLFLDYKDVWRSAQVEMRNQIYRWNSGFQSASEMVILMNRFLFETEAGDFPGRFCDNIHKILGALARAGNTLNFYSASVISLYEELALSLIFLVRPHEFLVPDSWHRLYFNRWEKKHRSPSGLERFWYQRYLIKVCLSFCEMVMNIERTPTREIALAKRSVILIVVCLINLGTCCPRPQGYAELWRTSQEVFCRDRLNASRLRNLRADKLIPRLALAFREYNRNDLICLVKSYEGCVLSFAGFPLERTGISVVKSSPTVEKERHLWEPSTDQETRRLNAAHILTVFWKWNGPIFVERMRERRREEFWRNFALLAEYGENEDSENEDSETEDSENEDSENEDSENEDSENEDSENEDWRFW
ncbi:hypothetical protein L873DRAFT_1842358 [Choiromyces venosus 120613-1]|uniref:UvrD-like helicase ATP-binding domain-containing protein n=1 Tax=Choiromyces venosus 120613-1 TaxID=1336337 RepID=A0A3N4JTJ2_9PEZI|nr:hypothetical protein L873DRAFT_1842358 [Choiromyces venosus 120613-1]